MIKPAIILIALLLFGCNGQSKKEDLSISNLEKEHTHCIKQIFERDSVFGDLRNHASEKMSISDAINNYSNNLKSLDFSNCPKKFETAFRKHIAAWIDFKKVSDNYPLLRGELHDIFAIMEKSKDSTAFKSRLDQILETWKMVEKHSNL